MTAITVTRCDGRDSTDERYHLIALAELCRYGPVTVPNEVICGALLTGLTKFLTSLRTFSGLPSGSVFKKQSTT